MTDLLAIPTFFAVKYFAYSSYSYLGIVAAGRSLQRRWLRACGLAFLRVLMGVGLGLALTLYFSRFHVYTNRLGIPEWFGSWVWTYVISYGVLRGLQWSLLAYLIWGWTTSRKSATVPWIVGGVGLSFLTDLLGFAAAIRIVGGIC
jgi:hypothetical protein